jgi:archaetidylinositol phosphate synthase
MVSYARARAEAAGVSQLGIGIAERPERLIILMAVTLFEYLTRTGFLFAPPMFFGISGWLEYGIILIAILAHITVVQRTVAAYRALARQSKEQEPQQESEGTV